MQSDRPSHFSKRALGLLLLAWTCAGCDGIDTSSSPAASIDVSSLPVTVEGFLSVDVAEGDVDAQGYSEFNFGSLEVGDQDLCVQVSGQLLNRAKVPEAGGLVRATLGSSSDEYGLTCYTVSALEGR